MLFYKHWGAAAGAGLAESIGRSFAQRRNNFDILRLAGSWLVLFSHSFALTGQANSEPVGIVLGGAADGGRLAVGMFFVVSGFLVSRSVEVHRPVDYLRARLLRLWPALAMVLLVQTLLIGPALTVLPAASYWADPATWTALGRGLLFNPRLGLPGVFTGNPFPDAVNGSLWTLRVELACYVLLLGAALGGLLRGPWIACLAAVAIAAVSLLQAGRPAAPLASGFSWPSFFWPASSWATAAWPDWIWDVRVDAAFDCGVHFLMGALLWVHREAVPRSAVLAAAGLLAMLTAAHTALAPIVFHVVFAYLVVCVGLGRPIGEAVMSRLGDVSYGTYLYAFPVQQALVAWSGGRIGPWALAAASSLPVLGLAVLSQRLVERPALRLKHRRAARAGPAAVGVLAVAPRRPG